jgi:hypothetical protein
MRANLYTNAVLTVIAACLVYICMGGPAIVPGASAQVPPAPQVTAPNATEVVIVGWKVDPSARGVATLGAFGLPMRTVPK